MDLREALKKLAEMRRDADAAQASVEEQARLVKQTPEGELLQALTT